MEKTLLFCSLKELSSLRRQLNIQTLFDKCAEII